MSPESPKESGHHIQSMYEDYFLEYASYVITDRAVPYVDDGLKPVQRRILHSLWEMDDGRFHKVANVIGNTMKYHPHGDAAIGDAMVGMGQKNLLIDTQGNWGDPMTGDSAAAARYIECKLSKFALRVAFNPETTVWQRSYDGRNREPVMLPLKFPLLLAQGAEGIAVGLSTRILPHNFCELIRCCISILRKESFKLLPDFPTGGMADCSGYNDGAQGAKIKVRAKIIAVDNKTLAITEIPFGTTTGTLIDTIIAANEKGKIKIKNIEDRTAESVEILIRLPNGSDADKTVDALYAFTGCESTLSPNCCVIRDNKPVFIGVSELVQMNVKDTVRLLKQELEIKIKDLQEKFLFRTLEQIFIEERIYRRIETCETMEAILSTIHKGLAPFSKRFIRSITDEDVTRLTEIRIKRISRFDAKKAEDEMIELKKGIEETEKNLKGLTKFAIAYYEDLLKTFGKGRERKTTLTQFSAISASDVILSNLKVYMDAEGGFVGTNLRGGEFITEASSLDEIIAFKEDGSFCVTKVADKSYVGKGIIHTARFIREGDKTIYNMLYKDGRGGPLMAKRFTMSGITRDKQYDLTRGSENSKVMHFSTQLPGQSEKVDVHLVPKPRVKSPITVAFNEFEIRNRNAVGSIVTKHTVKRVGGSEVKESKKAKAEEAKASLVTVYYDRRKRLIGTAVEGEELCETQSNSGVLVLFKDGEATLWKPVESEKLDKPAEFFFPWEDELRLCLLYVNGENFSIYGKHVKPNLSPGRSMRMIPVHEQSSLEFASVAANPTLELQYKPLKGQPDSQKVYLSDRSFPEVPGNAAGSRITTRTLKNVRIVERGSGEEQTSLF